MFKNTDEFLLDEEVDLLPLKDMFKFRKKRSFSILVKTGLNDNK